MKMAYSVVIAEDYKMARDVFAATVEDSELFTLAAVFNTAYDAMDWFEHNTADLVLMDVLIPGSINGISAAKIIKERSPATKIIIVTSMPEISYIDRAKAVGAESFWYKELQEQPLLELMTRTVNGESIYPAQSPVVQFGSTLSSELTGREKSVLRELVDGRSNKEIAEKLGIAENTVKMNITNMLTKTGYKSRLELALKARHLGLVIRD